jgi:2Fe-2S ferredoxin
MHLTKIRDQLILRFDDAERVLGFPVAMCRRHTVTAAPADCLLQALRWSATMAKVTFVCPAGQRREIAAPLGTNLMKIAITNGIDEILAECGGSAVCGTCHVYVEAAMLALLPPIMQAEDETLDTAASERRPNSRLCCQIVMTNDLDGLVLHLPLSQV